MAVLNGVQSMRLATLLSAGRSLGVGMSDVGILAKHLSLKEVSFLPTRIPYYSLHLSSQEHLEGLHGGTHVHSSHLQHIALAAGQCQL